MKYFWHVIHILQILFSLTACILFPIWIRDGFLVDWYPKVGAFIASYGGLVGGVIWYYQNIKHIE